MDEEQRPIGSLRSAGRFRPADYRACVTSGQCTRPKDHARNRYCNSDAPGRDRHPVNCVDWQRVLDYCRWRGRRQHC